MANYQDILTESTRVANEIAMLYGGTFQQGVGFIPNQSSNGSSNRRNTSTRLNANEIGSTNAYPLPQNQPQTNNLSTLLSSFSSGFGAQQNQQGVPQQQTQPSWRDSITGRLEEIIGLQSKQGAKTLKYQEEEDVFGKKKLARELENKYLSRQKAAQDRVVELEKNSRGQTTQALGYEIDKFSQDSERELANIAIQQRVASGAYNEAIEIVSSKIDAEFAPLRDEAESLRSLYSIMQNDLTDSEKMIAQANINMAQNQYQDLVDTKKQIATSLIENGRTDLIAGLDQYSDVTSMIQYAGRAGIPVANLLQTQIQRAQLEKLNAEAAALKVQPITNPEAAQYAGALSVILGSDKFTVQQRNSIAAAINSGQDPLAVVKNQAKNIMGATQSNDVAKLESSLSAMEQLQSTLDAYYAAGGQSGVFRGNFEKVINKLGAVNNPQLVGIAVQVASSLQKYRNAISGTAYSEQEGRDIASIFPGITNGQILNSVIAQSRIQSIENDINSAYRSVLGTTYDSIISPQAGGSQSQPTNQSDPLGLFLGSFGISR